MLFRSIFRIRGADDSVVKTCHVWIRITCDANYARLPDCSCVNNVFVPRLNAQTLYGVYRKAGIVPQLRCCIYSSKTLATNY